jgi:hypothetical protein
VKLALNHRGDLVRANAVGPYSFGLRCPHCKEPVFARPGSLREAHFAHRSGNANKACELYYPGNGTDWQPSERTQAPHPSAKERLGAPALLWKSEEALAASLYLRLPTHPQGFASTVRVTSFATSQYRGSDLTKPAFVRLRLQTPPGQVHTSPVDESLEQALMETLDQFRLTGNYFRATGEGGVLVPPDQPLELGQAYWLLTQFQLGNPVSEFVSIEEHRADRAWHAYRIALACDPQDVELALSELAQYLSRDVIRLRPSIKLLWPLPDSRDPDGVRVFNSGVRELLVRSPSGPPHVRLQRTNGSVGDRLENDLYSIKIAPNEPEALVGLPNGRWERVRFEACELRLPGSVWLSNQTERVALFEPHAEKVIASGMPLQIDVPVHRVWRLLSVDEQPIRPIPDGLSYEIQGALSGIEAGVFGSARLPKDAETHTPTAWWMMSERLVRAMKGDRAATGLRLVSDQAMLLRWAREHQATALLPKLMFEISKGARQ